MIKKLKSLLLETYYQCVIADFVREKSWNLMTTFYLTYLQINFYRTYLQCRLSEKVRFLNCIKCATSVLLICYLGRFLKENWFLRRVKSANRILQLAGCWSGKTFGNVLVSTKAFRHLDCRSLLSLFLRGVFHYNCIVFRKQHCCKYARVSFLWSCINFI